MTREQAVKARRLRGQRFLDWVDGIDSHSLAEGRRKRESRLDWNEQLDELIPEEYDPAGCERYSGCPCWACSDIRCPPC